MTERRCIALIGMRGAGKTAVGRVLAERLSLPFIDTDERIASAAGLTIAEIFARHGEEYFRRLEHDIIMALRPEPPVVIAVGGGAVLDPHNVAHLRAIARVVWLTAPPDVLWRRICGDAETPASRPALTDRPGPEEVHALLAQRLPLYAAAADVSLDTSDLAPAATADHVLRLLSVDQPPASPR